MKIGILKLIIEEPDRRLEMNYNTETHEITQSCPTFPSESEIFIAAVQHLKAHIIFQNRKEARRNVESRSDIMTDEDKDVKNQENINRVS